MKCNSTTQMIWLKFALNLPKLSMDDLGRFAANLSQIILVVALHFTFYYRNGSPPSAYSMDYLIHLNVV